MNIESLRSFFLWCTIINYAILIFGVLLVVFARDWGFRIVNRLFHISDDRFDSLNYTWIAFYKIAIILFNLVPYIVLRIIQ